MAEYTAPYFFKPRVTYFAGGPFLQRPLCVVVYIKLLKNAFKNAIKGPAAAIDGSNSFNVIKTTIVKIEGQSHVK